MSKVNTHSKETNIKITSIEDGKKIPFTLDKFIDIQKNATDFVMNNKTDTLVVVKELIISDGSIVGSVEVHVVHTRSAVNDNRPMTSDVVLIVTPEVKINNWIGQNKDPNRLSRFLEMCREVASSLNIDTANVHLSRFELMAERLKENELLKKGKKVTLH